MKKFLALALALALALSCTVAFAHVGHVDVDYSTQEKYTINWTQYYVVPALEDAFTIKLLEDTFNVDINILPIEDSTFMEVLNSYIMGGNTPDIMRLKDPTIFNQYVEQEVLGEINMDLVKEYFPIYYDGMSEYAGGQFLTYGAFDGVQYGLPSVSTGNLFHLPVIYNKTWMDKVGVAETPKTLDELHDLMVKFTKEDPDGNGVDDTYGLSSDGMRNVFGAYGINPGAADGRNDHSAFQVIDGEFVYAATSSRYKEALKTLKAWYDEGLIDPEFITGENAGGYWAISHSIVNHRIGMTVRANYYHWVAAGAYQEMSETGEMIDCEPGAVAKEFYAANPDEVLVFGDPVVGPYGESGVKNWNMLAQVWAFSPELVADEGKFIRVLEIMNFCARSSLNIPEVTQEYLEDFYGPEGEWWFWKNKETCSWGSTKAFIDFDDTASGVDKHGREEYGPSAPRESVSELTTYANGLGYKEHGISTLMQFSLPLMAEYQNNLTSLKDNWMVNFITGKKDIDNDWDAYIAEMNASGLAAMFAEAKAYYESTNK